MTPSTFPLTIGCLFSQEVWIVYCPEWGYECRAISKETDKKSSKDRRYTGSNNRLSAAYPDYSTNFAR